VTSRQLGGATIGTGGGAYLRLLRHGPAARPFLAALVARLPMAMAPIGMLLLVQHERDAYSIAGFVTGAFAVGSAAGTPVWGRLMDRYGQTRVLLPTSLASAGLLVALALATIWGGVTPLLIALSAGAGLSYPPISPALRVAWRVIFPDPESRRVAFALDATSIELIFVGGPLLLSVLLALTVPVVPLLVTAGLMAVGGVAYCRTEAARLSRPGGEHLRVPPSGPTEPGMRHRGGRSAVTASGVGALLAVMLTLSIGFGQLDTSMAATAGALLGGTEHVGLLFAAIAGGSTIGGLVFGSRSWPFDERHAVPVLLTVFAVLLSVMAVLMARPPANLWLVFPLLFVTGCTIAPTLIMQQALLDHLAPAHRLNEAQAFLSASNTTGAAVGTALAGLLIDYRGINWAFGGAALGAGLAAALAAFSQGHWRSAETAVDEFAAGAQLRADTGLRVETGPSADLGLPADAGLPADSELRAGCSTGGRDRPPAASSDWPAAS
jgi:MFS family permease